MTRFSLVVRYWPNNVVVLCVPQPHRFVFFMSGKGKVELIRDGGWAIMQTSELHTNIISIFHLR